MLDDLAIRLVSQDESVLTALGLAVAAAGFVVAAIRKAKDTTELERAPYFAYTMLLLLIGTTLGFLWLFTAQAVAAGLFWLLTLIVFLATAAVGFFYGVVSLARSRDAFGSAGYAALAWVPLLNLILLFKPSKNLMSGNRIPTIPVMTGGLGVVFGLVMGAFAAGLNAVLESEIDQMARQTEAEPTLAQLIPSEGIDGALQAIAAETQEQLPVALDEVTTLRAVEASGNHLRRTFVVTVEDFVLSSEFRDHVNAEVCGYDFFNSLLEAGATIEESYVDDTGLSFGTHQVTLESCHP